MKVQHIEFSKTTVEVKLKAFGALTIDGHLRLTFFKPHSNENQSKPSFSMRGFEILHDIIVNYFNWRRKFSLLLQ